MTERGNNKNDQVETPQFCHSDETAFDNVFAKQSEIDDHDLSEVFSILAAQVNRLTKLTSTNPDHQIIYRAISSSLHTTWFNELKQNTQTTFLARVRFFINWMNEIDVNRKKEHRYECIDDYGAFRISVAGVKNTDSATIKNLLKHGMNAASLLQDDLLYIRNLIKVTKKNIRSAAESYTMSDWFSITWLREVLGEAKYLQLESPSRLFLSFRITIATTLQYLLEAREQWYEKIDEAPIKENIQKWHAKWGLNLLKKIGSLKSDGTPDDVLTKCLWLDLVSPSGQDRLKEKIYSQGLENLSNVREYFLRPLLFDENYHHRYSLIEERLAAWLIACETIQPSDVQKIKTTHYAMEYNSNGRLLFMQCNYYKGRSGDFKYPKILMASDCWTKAIHKYISGLESGASLFQTNINSGINIPTLDMTSTGYSIFHFFFNLWSSEDLQKRIYSALDHGKAQPIFLEAILSLRKGSKSSESFRRESGATRRVYEANVPRPLPSYLFKLTHIKTSAVHAGSDMYRDSDLINHHSHSSNTEKQHYLTDANKDWVNRCGRITRLVLYSLQNVVYRPSVENITKMVTEYDAKTEVIKPNYISATHPGATDDLSLASYDEYDTIIVTDTVDSALYFIHYLNQTEKFIEQLLRSRPDFVERILLPKVEWMSRTLNRMVSAKAATEQYHNYAEHLPSLFSYLFESKE